MDKTDIPRNWPVDETPSVFEIGSVRSLPIHPDRVLPFWVFAVVTSGRVPVRVGSDSAVVPTGHYYLLPPGVRHYGTAESPFDAVWFHFTLQGGAGAEGTERPSPAGGRGQPDLLPFHGPAPPEINYHAWGHLLRENLAMGTMRLADVDLQLAAILGQVAAECRKQQTLARPGASLARRTLELLLGAYRESITADWLSRRLGYSYGHIEREFRKQYGMTIRHKLAAIRVDEAAALITMGRSLREAADETGFADYYYFIRVFTKLKGQSPGRLRAGR